MWYLRKTSRLSLLARGGEGKIQDREKDGNERDFIKFPIRQDIPLVLKYKIVHKAKCKREHVPLQKRNDKYKDTQTNVKTQRLGM